MRFDRYRAGVRHRAVGVPSARFALGRRHLASGTLSPSRGLPVGGGSVTR
jgi:hypothetical protein